jgi:hypothetical protein
MYKLTIASLISNIIIALLPFYWWYYGIGNLIEVADSPFMLNVIFLGSHLEIIQIVNLLLLAFRFYVVIVSGIYLYYVLKGKKKTYGLIFWSSYFYILDPVVFYIIFNYLFPLIGYGFHYPFFIIGKEEINFAYKNTIVFASVYSYPTLAYWISLGSGTIYLFSRIFKR